MEQGGLRPLLPRERAGLCVGAGRQHTTCSGLAPWPLGQVSDGIPPKGHPLPNQRAHGLYMAVLASAYALCPLARPLPTGDPGGRAPVVWRMIWGQGQQPKSRQWLTATVIYVSTDINQSAVGAGKQPWCVSEWVWLSPVKLHLQVSRHGPLALLCHTSS